MAEPLIVTAEMGAADFSRLDGLRRAHFPPERNVLGAHLTMFHALPPSVEPEAKSMLAGLAALPAPTAQITGVRDLGRGVAFAVESPDLQTIRNQISEHFHGCLTAQDAAIWRPHVTIQNKVERREAVALRDRLLRDFEVRPLIIRGLELHHYLGGPWDLVRRWRFRG